jgi:hypothetical protein
MISRIIKHYPQPLRHPLGPELAGELLSREVVGD